MLKLGLGVNKPSGNVGAPPTPPARYTPTVFEVTEDSSGLQASLTFELQAAVSPVLAGTYLGGDGFPTQATITAKSGGTTLFYIEGVDFTIQSVIQLGDTANLALASASYDITQDVVMVAEEIPAGDIDYEIEFFFTNAVDGVYLNTGGQNVTLSYTVLFTEVDSEDNSVLVYDLGEVSITDSASPNTVSVDMQLQFQYDPAPPASGIDPVTLPVVCSLTAYQDVDGTEQQIFTKSFTSITFEETSIPSGPGFLNATLTVDVDNEATFGDFPILNKAIKYVFAIDTEATNIDYAPFETGEYEAIVELEQTNLTQSYTYTYSIYDFSVVDFQGVNNVYFVGINFSVDFDGETFNYYTTGFGEGDVISMNATLRAKQTIDGVETVLFEIPNINPVKSTVLSNDLVKVSFNRTLSLPEDLPEGNCFVSPQYGQIITYELEVSASQVTGDYTIELSSPTNTSEFFTDSKDTQLSYSCDPNVEFSVDSYYYYSLSNRSTHNYVSNDSENYVVNRYFMIIMTSLDEAYPEPITLYNENTIQSLFTNSQITVGIESYYGSELNYGLQSAAIVTNASEFVSLEDTAQIFNQCGYIMKLAITLADCELDSSYVINDDTAFIAVKLTMATPNSYNYEPKGANLTFSTSPIYPTLLRYPVHYSIKAAGHLGINFSYDP